MLILGITTEFRRGRHRGIASPLHTIRMHALATPGSGLEDAAMEDQMAQNTYEATIKLQNGDLEKVAIGATSWNHARQLLEAQYGVGRVMNLHQK